jgi:hypothetical protein
MTDSKKKKRGRPAEILAIPGDWAAAVKSALAKGKPPAKKAAKKKAAKKKRRPG